MPKITKRKYTYLLIILLSSLILLVIMQPWNLYFLNDDFEHIPIAGVNMLVTKNFLRPVANLFLFLDKKLYGKWAPGYFFTTWFLHSACTVSIYLACEKAIKKYVPDLPAYTSLIGALFFLFYPFHAEPLFWIIGRGAVIATLFSLLSLYYYIRKDENRSYLLLSLLLFILALFTYESIWGILFFYCLISFLNVKKQFATARKEYTQAAAFLFTFLAYFATRFFALDTFTGEYSEINNNLFKIPLLLTNLVKLFARNFTPPFQNTSISVIFFCVSAIIYAVATILMFRRTKSAGWLMIILWLGVLSGIITATPLGIDTHGNESERYIYYSSFSFCFFLAIVVTKINKKEWKYGAAGFILIIEMAALIVYNAHYRYTSVVVKTSLEFIKKYPDYKNAYFVDVPGEYKGALIFRVCLPNAIHWMAPDCKYDSIKTISKTEDASGIIPFKTGEKTWEEFTGEKNFKSQRNTYSLKDSLNRSIILNKNDALFWFTPQGLYKINEP